MEIRCEKMMKTNLTTGHFLNKPKPFFKPRFNQLPCQGNSTQPGQNAAINPSVVNLASCDKWAHKHKYIEFNNYGESGIGT